MQKLSPLGDLIDIREQIDRDQQLERSVTRERDRAIGLQSAAAGVPAKNRLAQLRFWIAALRTEGHGSDIGTRVDHGLRNIVVLCWAIGCVIGYLLASSVLSYDGSEPVNLLIALLVLVGVQTLALMLLVILMVFRWDKLLSALSVLNPANLIMQLIGRLQPAWRETLTTFSTRLHHAGSPALTPQLTAYLAQHFAIALNIGMLGALFYLVTVTDLAFGWNTTLSIDSSTVGQLFQGLAVPWQSLLPAAVPDNELIDASRFYRLQSQLRSGGWQAKELGTWWAYLAMCIGVYGFLPRVIALVITGMRYDKAVTRATLSLPGSSQVLTRMSNPLVSTEAPQPESTGGSGVTRPGLPGRQSARDMRCLLVEWAACTPTEEGLKRAGVIAAQRLQAGGRQTPSEDRQTANAAANGDYEGIALAVKSWEPPMLEVNDFLALLRQNAPAPKPIIVLLQPLAAKEVTPSQLEVWETALGTMSDSALYLESL